MTDSAADFELKELEAMNVECIPLSVSFADKVYIENIEITKQEFYQKLKTEKAFPRTSQPSPLALEEAFQRAKDAGESTVMITISSGLSGTYQGAVRAREAVGYEDCYIIDSLNATGAERLLVEYAVKLRDEGRQAQEIVQMVESVRPRVTLYAAMDTLEYLFRGGRISRAAYTVGALANIKPILGVTKDGKPEIPAKMLGMARAIRFMHKQLSTLPPDPDFPLYVMYTSSRESGVSLAQYLARNGYVVPQERIVGVGAVVGSHIGSDACGIVYVTRE